MFEITDYKRKAHVKRVYRIDPDSGDKDKSVWLDLLRLDEFFLTYKAIENGKTITARFKLKWNDDPNNPDPDLGAGDDQQENGNPNRKVKLTTIVDQDDQNDPQVSIDLYVIDVSRINTRGGAQPGDDSGLSHQTAAWVFNNDRDQNQSRQVTALTVQNNDLGGTDNMDMDTRLWVDWETEYLPALQKGNIDKTQRIDFEFPDKFLLNFGVQVLTDGKRGQGIRNIMWKNKPIENLFTLDPETTRVPVRIDPFQMIVNVAWNRGVWLAVAQIGQGTYSWSNTIHCQCPALPGDNGIPPPPVDHSDSGTDFFRPLIFYRSTDGTNWEKIDYSSTLNFELASFSAMNGYFVIGSGVVGTGNLVANINCQQPESPGTVYNFPCAVNGDAPFTSAVAMKSADLGKTWSVVGDARDDYTGVSIQTNVDANSFTVKYGTNPPGSPGVSIDVPITWERNKYPFPTVTGPNVGNKTTLVRTDVNDGTTATLQTSTDGGTTWKTTLTVDSEPGYNQGFVVLIFQPTP